MKYIYLAISTILLACWVIFGNYAGPAGLPVPALGQFFHPAKGFWRNTLPKLSERKGGHEVNIDHPLAKGSIFFDERGVPHIFGDDLADVCFLQGYVHAADRMWQMDISTRATEGRLSEILGSRTMKRDSQQIRRGYRYMAQKTIDTMSVHFPNDIQALQAYSDGYNAYLDQLDPMDYPVEYKLLDHKPLRWSPYRTALLMKGMSQSLSGRSYDVAAAKTRDDLGLEVYQELFPERFPGASPIVPDEGKYSPAEATASQEGATSLLLNPFPAPAAAPDATEKPQYATAPVEAEDQVTEPYTLMPLHPDNGSNNWAVDGNFSNTGRPLLASDPHLALTLPSIWYEQQIVFPGVNARGVGLPGAPGIMIGFNDHMAFGETNVGHDVTDWFRIEWTNENRTHYMLDGKEVAARIQYDTLVIKGRPKVVVETPWTIFGPVPYTEGPYADHAMRYLAHDAPGASQRPHTMVGTFWGLTKAHNYDDYVNALKGYVDPAQNFIFADKTGTIALRPNGGFPLRGNFSGRFPTPGNAAANNWLGYIPFEDRPEHKNPKRGFVSSANQVTTGPNYPYSYHGGFDEYRGRYINRRLSRVKTMNQRKMKELQLSSYSLLAEELTPLLIARINRSGLSSEDARLLRLLSEWDYHCEGDSRAAALFEQWRVKLLELTFDEMPRDSGYLQPEQWKWTALLKDQPQHKVFDILSTPDFRETAATITQRAFDEVVEDLNGELPPTWAEMRNTTIRHLGAVPGFGSDLITTGGARFSPRALSGGHGASWRMVVELGPEPRAWGTLPGGAAGDPASEYYDNGIDDWEHGRYHELIRWMDSKQANRNAIGGWIFGTSTSSEKEASSD